MEIILVASGKGGVGKSTISTNLASTFAKKEHKTCVIDLDLNLGKLDILLGLESKVEHDISDIILKKLHVNDTLIQDENNSNLFLLPASRNVDDVLLTSQDLLNILNELRDNSFEFVILDCPAGVDKANPFRAAAKCANRAIIVTNPEKTSLRDADVIISILENHNFNSNDKLHLIINKYIEPKFMTKKKFLKAKDIETSLAIPLIATIKYSDNYISYSNQATTAISLNKRVANEYNLLYNKLINLNTKHV